jgi:hypothetical protein
MHNDLRLADIDHDLIVAHPDRLAIAAAQRDLRLAAIRLAEAERLLANLRERDPDLVSTSEITRQERAVLRARLQQERSALLLARAQAAPDELSRRSADLTLLRKRLNASTTEQQIAFDLARREHSVRWAEVQVQRSQRYLEERRGWQTNLELKAPVGGLVQYHLTWSGGSLTKVEKGTTVHGSVRILKIADTSRMEVRVPVPEAYFTRVTKGMTVTVSGEDLPVLKGTVSAIEFVFEPRRRNDSDIGLYSEREPGGETVFSVRIALETVPGVELKPGAVVEATFPFSADGQSPALAEGNP